MSKRSNALVIVSDDYAAINAGGVDAYYGYEFGKTPNGDEVWGFRMAVSGTVVVQMEYAQLATKSARPGTLDRGDCAECLLVGIGAALIAGVLKGSGT